MGEQSCAQEKEINNLLIIQNSIRLFIRIEHVTCNKFYKVGHQQSVDKKRKYDVS